MVLFTFLQAIRFLMLELADTAVSAVTEAISVGIESAYGREVRDKVIRSIVNWDSGLTPTDIRVLLDIQFTDLAKLMPNWHGSGPPTITHLWLTSQQLVVLRGYLLRC